jgi:hypothetical protein
MAVLIGANIYLEYQGVSLVGDERKFDPGLQWDTTEASAGGDAVRVYTKTLLKVEPKLTLIVDTNASGIAQRAVLKLGATGNLIWGPEGNAAGKPKWGVVADIKKSTPSFQYDKEQELEVEFFVSSGALLYDGTTITF